MPPATASTSIQAPVGSVRVRRRLVHVLVLFVAFFATRRDQDQMADAYRMLVIPVPSRSHVLSLVAVAEGLAGRGHNVTLLVGRSFRLDGLLVPDGARTSGIVNVERYADSPDAMGVVNYDAAFEDVTSIALERKASTLELLPLMRERTEEFCRRMTTDNEPTFARLERQQFHLAVVDGIMFMKCIYLVPHRLRIPWVTYTDVLDPLDVRVPWLPSFVPQPLFPYTDRMSFVERLANVAFVAASSLYRPFPDPPDETLDEFRRRGGQFSSLDELASRSLLWLVTKHPVLDYPRPTMPNMINVGGLTVRTSTRRLPDDVGGFVDAAENGFFFVSFGTTVSSLPQETVREFASAFRRLDGYRVVWRLNNKDNVELPDNVMIRPWLPQNDILAHPRVRLFITHCGNNGQYEAVYHAVPMIGFPLLADQLHNARRLVHKGYGISMNIHKFSADELLENMNKIVTNGSYKERMVKASEIFQSQPQTPSERASFWIEHVCKFGGDHLRSAGNDLPIYSYLMLDILALVTLATLFVVYLPSWLIFHLMRHLFGTLEKRKLE